MEEKYKKFLNYNWNQSEEWKKYFTNLSEIPKSRELLIHFKKRFYKFKIDPDFDIKFHPENIVESKIENNSENQNFITKNENKKSKGIFDNLFASIEGFIWVAFLFNLLLQSNLLKLSFVATCLRFFRKTENLYLSLKLNKEFVIILFKNENIQLLFYILILSFDNLSYFLIFPIIMSALYSICDYFANYLRIFTFMKKYFEKIINKKDEMDKIKGFAFVFIYFYVIISLLINWHKLSFFILYSLFLVFMFYYNTEVKNTFNKFKNSLEYIEYKYGDKIPLFMRNLIRKYFIDNENKNK